MLSAEFYERFLAWDYILLCQTDAFVFRDELADWCARGYDYIGAPWPLRPIYSNPLYKIGSRLKSFCCEKIMNSVILFAIKWVMAASLCVGLEQFTTCSKIIRSVLPTTKSGLDSVPDIMRMSFMP